MAPNKLKTSAHPGQMCPNKAQERVPSAASTHKPAHRSCVTTAHLFAVDAHLPVALCVITNHTDAPHRTSKKGANQQVPAARFELAALASCEGQPDNRRANGYKQRHCGRGKGTGRMTNYALTLEDGAG